MKSNNRHKLKRKITVCFFGAYDRAYTSNMIVLQGLHENNVNVVEVNAHVPLTRLDRQEDMSWILLIKRILKKYRIFVEIFKNLDGIKKCDVIYIGFPGHFEVFLAYIIAKFFRKKLVFNPIIIFYIGFVEDQKFIKKGSTLEKLIKIGEKVVYRFCDLILADTPLQQDFLEKYFDIPKKKLRSLPLGADNKLYKYTPYLVKPNNIINVVYYGLYTPLHGVKYIIEAAHILRKEKGINFIFVGQGNTFEENYNLAKKLKLTNVEFIHDVPVEQHTPYLKKADLFLGFLEDHPTVKRVIPNKVYQGMSLGKVVVAADAPVMRSVFSDRETVYLCKASSSKDLARVIIDLKNSPELRTKIAENGHKLYVKNFTPMAVGKQLIKYIEEIL